MVMPEHMPVFTYDDIIEPPAEEFEDGCRKSTIGWLQHIFLYYICPDDEECLQIRPEDRKDYEKAVDILQKECKIRGSLLKWEETATRKSQAAALNTLRKKLGYVVEFYEKV